MLATSCDIQRLHVCYAATDVCLEGVLANSGVYMENGSFLLCSIATDMWLAAKSRIYMIGGGLWGEQCGLLWRASTWSLLIQL